MPRGWDKDLVVLPPLDDASLTLTTLPLMRWLGVKCELADVSCTNQHVAHAA